MKKIGILMMLLMAVNLLYAQSSKIIVESDKNLDADLGKYKTYQFSPQLLDNTNALFFFNDLILKENIIRAVEYELESRGYESTAASPDMVINFRVFEKPTQLVGYTAPETTYWGNQKVREPEDKKTYDLKAGTLLLQMVDRKTGELLWQGYASGILDGMVFDRKKERIAEAVSLIFEEFEQRADNLTRK